MDAKHNRLNTLTCRITAIYAVILTLYVIPLGASIVYGSPASVVFVGQAEFGSGPTIPVAWGDYDNDGDLDLAVGEVGGDNGLYTNNGGNTFSGVTEFGAGSTFAIAWGDYDNDGDLDAAVGNGSNEQNYLYVNNGDTTFTPLARFGVNSTIAMAWADFDNDGDLDLAVGNGILGSDQQNYLYVNNGDDTFTERAEFGGFQTDSIAWGDFDGDGDFDLAVGNGGFAQSQSNFLYIYNSTTDRFQRQTVFGTGDTAAVAWGDYDNDGDLDLAVGNWESGQSYLYVNEGGVFTEQPQFGDRDTNTVAWGDHDLDGYLDLAVGNGDFGSEDQNYLYVNNGGVSFAEQAAFGLGSTASVAWGDRDGDGDLDLAAGNEHSPPQNYLYINTLSGGTYLALHLVGHRYDYGSGYSNRDGIGAKLHVYDAGFLGDVDHLLGFREIEAHGGFSPQNSIDATFGLPGAADADVRIIWPGSDGANVVTDILAVAVNQRLTVHEATPMPLGSCCDPYGQCRLNSEFECSHDTWTEDGVCDPNTCPVFAVAPALPPAPHDARKNRYITIDTTTNGPVSVSYRVTLSSMRRCTGDDRRSCVIDDDCPGVCDLNHDLQCSDDAICGGDGPCVATSPCVEHDDVGAVVRYVGEPYQNTCVPLADCSDQWFATRSPTPVYRVWTENIVHLLDCTIIPVAQYDVQACTPPDEAFCSDPLVITTIGRPQVHYADCVGAVVDGQYTPADGFTNVTDVQAFLAAQKGNANAPHTTWVDLHSGSLPVVPQQILNVGDLQTIKAGFTGKTFVETPGHEDPGNCP